MGIGAISTWQLIIIIAMFWPTVHSLITKQVHGWKKFNFFLLSFLFSWIGYLLYYFIAVKRKKEPFTWGSSDSN